MDDEGAVVHQDPFGVLEAFDSDGAIALRLQLLFNLVGDGLILSRVAAVADDENVGDGGDAAEIERLNIDRLFLIGRANGCEPSVVQLFGRFFDYFWWGWGDAFQRLSSGPSARQILLLCGVSYYNQDIMWLPRLTSAFALFAAVSLAAPETAAVRAARESLEQTRKLAEAGAVSRKQLEAAEKALEQAKDDAVIASTIDAQLSVEDLTEEQTGEMSAAAKRGLARELARLEAHAKLVSEGVAPRTSLRSFELDVERARRIVDVAEERTRTLQEIASMIRAEEEAADAPAPDMPSIADGPIQRITRFKGAMKFGNEELKAVVLEYEKKFDRKLPVSARGATALHRSMGFDHTGRVDVALNPDQVEGRWLMRYLEKADIPFFAFRTYVKGQATAPHIHIGPPSTRIRATD